MAKELNTPLKKEKRKVRMTLRLALPMLFTILLQLGIFLAILYIGGEFRYIEQYAYSTLTEKTENRRNYLETELQAKVPYVSE